jgi:hypothetical protein
MEKSSEDYYNEGMKDFLSKIPDINSYDFWFRFGQTLLENSDKKEPIKSISHIVANAIVKALDNRKN